nr:MAG TPA: hypothetical protein [Caudoviricetes sp.]
MFKGLFPPLMCVFSSFLVFAREDGKIYIASCAK